MGSRLAKILPQQPSPPTDPEIAALRRRVEALEAAVEALRPKPDERFAAMLPRMYAALGDYSFAPEGLVAAASSARDDELLRLVASVLGPPPRKGRQDGRRKRLGHFLAKHAGRVVGDLRLVRVGTDHSGHVYCVVPSARRF